MIMGMDNEKQINASYTLSPRGKQAFVKPYFNDKLDSEFLRRNVILKSWGIQNPDGYINRIHIPCGFKIFNFAEIIENYNKNRG